MGQIYELILIFGRNYLRQITRCLIQSNEIPVFTQNHKYYCRNSLEQ